MVPIERATGWSEFAKRFRGVLINPTHPQYEDLRRIWNADFDKRPRLIARCTSTADVVAAVRFARAADLLVAVRAGGHSYPGHSTCEGGLLIDLRLMSAVTVDADARTVCIQGGALLGEVDNATAPMSMAMPAGVVSHTGMGGLSLGGGFGYLSRQFGMTCDSFLELTVVTADGEVVKASATEHPNLFWGLRGGGGNFGIVTEFKSRIYPLGPVQTGWLYFPMEQAADILRAYREVPVSASRQLAVYMMLGTPAEHALAPVECKPGRKLLGLRLFHAGDERTAAREMQPLRTSVKPLVDTIQTRRFIDVQQEFDVFAQHGIGWYMKSAQTRKLSNAAIDTAINASMRHNSPRVLLGIISMGGAISDVGEMDSAYSGRDALWHISLEVGFTAPEERTDLVAWSRTTHSELTPLLDRQTSYVNMLDDTDLGRLEALYGAEKFRRLRAVKAEYDPDNFFRCNSNIPPAPKLG
jgi:hypothetical protein